MTILNATRHATIASKVCCADTAAKRMRGLLGRNSLDPQEALIIRPCQSVHMLFMRFPIDVIFLDRQQRIIGLCRQLQPFMFSPIFWKSSCAIELPAGTIDTTNSQIGDQIRF